MTENIQKEIIQAAESRFSHYGYRKTTMAEIAGDVGMSVANIYRYFANKEEIMAVCAERCVNERLQKLQTIVEDPSMNATEKLTGYTLATLHFSHDLASKNDRINELIEAMTKRKPGVVLDRVQKQINLIRLILEEGCESGEFAIRNIEETAQAIHTCLIVFDVPLFMDLYPLEKFEQTAKSIIRLVTRGINRE